MLFSEQIIDAELGYHSHNFWQKWGGSETSIALSLPKKEKKRKKKKIKKDEKKKKTKN